ncbi:hypothetical protein ACX5K5_17155 (plasmid) [Glutamicibacter bergerei]
MSSVVLLGEFCGDNLIAAAERTHAVHESEYTAAVAARAFNLIL